MTILIATDLSGRSLLALGRAVLLARRHHVRLLVLHVVDDSMPEAVRRATGDAARHSIQASLEGLRRSGDPQAEICITPGNPHRRIAEAAAAAEARLVVLGRHRDDSVAAAEGGTTLHRVLRTVERPMLVVAGPAAGDYSRVLVGIDFSAAARAALRAALALAPGADFTFVHAWQVPFEGFLSGAGTRMDVAAEHERRLARLVDEELRLLAEAAGPAPSATVSVLCPGAVRNVLRHEVEARKPDLLAIGTHGRTGLARAVLGSVAQDLLDRPPTDILAIRPPDA